MTSFAANRAVFLDRDGTITRDVGFTHRLEDLQLLPGAAAGLRQMESLGYRLFITTNQSGVARGYFTETHVDAFNAALCERLRSDGVRIEAVYYCPFHPTEGIGSYRRPSPMRKPGDGMIRLAAEEHKLDLAASFAVGDKESDVLAGQRAGCRTILVCTRSDRSGEGDLPAPPDFVAADLFEAARWMAAVPSPNDRLAPGEPKSQRTRR